MDLPLSMRRKQLSTVLLLLSLILACLDGSAVVRAGEPPAVKLVDEALVSLGFTPGRVIAANNLGSPVVAASKDSQGAKLTVSVYYFPDYASLAASDWNKTLAEQANVDVGAGGWARARQNNSLRSEGSGSQQTWTPKGVGGVDFVCGGLMTSVGCVLESSARLKDQAQAKTEMARLGGEAEKKALDLAKQAAGAFADRQLCAGEVKKLPIIFLAGIAGSRLSDSNSGELWPLGLGDRSWLALNPDGNTPAFSSAKIAPNGIFYDQELQSMLGGAGWFANTPWPRRYQFAYDWRLDNTSQVQALAKKVSEVLFDSGEKKVILIAHSMGGLIARAYINTSGADKVDTLITINTPFYGAPKAYYAAISGYNFGNWTVNQGMMKAICQNWPAGYQLMPRVPFVVDGRTNKLFPLSVSNGIRYKWFEGVKPYAFFKDVYTPSKDNILGLNPALIERANQFYKLLYQDDGAARPLPVGVRHYVIAGYGVSTLSSFGAIDVRANEPGVEMDGRKVRLVPTFGDGDGTVPHWSLDFKAVTGQYWIPDQDKSASAGHQELMDNPYMLDLVRLIVLKQQPDPTKLGYPGAPGALRMTETIDFTLQSDAHLAIVDEATGDRLGYNDKGLIEEGISAGSFISMDEGEYASLGGLNRNVLVTVTGMQQGKFTLTVQVNKNSGSTVYAYGEVPVQEGTVAQLRFNPGGTAGAPPDLAVTTGGRTTNVKAQPAGGEAPSGGTQRPTEIQSPEVTQQPTVTQQPGSSQAPTATQQAGGGGPSGIGPYGSQPGAASTPGETQRKSGPCPGAPALAALGVAAAAFFRRGH